MLKNDDNFHPASEVVHYHHPEIGDTNCQVNATSQPCTVSHISVTENKYDNLDEEELAKTPIASTQMLVKLKSSQSLHQTAGEPNASFEYLDQQLDEC